MYTNIIEILEERARENGEKAFLVDNDKTYSYYMVEKIAKRIGKNLSGCCDFSKPVLVLINRKAISVVTFLGIVYAGSFYVPIDSNLPIARINKIIQITNADVIIASEKNQNIVKDINFDGKVLLYERLTKEQEEYDESSTDFEELECIKKKHISSNPLYMIFTSGSTGEPKGVVVSHQSILDLQDRFQKAFNFDSNEVFANQAPFDFDVSVKDIFLTLYNGATMIIVDQSYFVNPKELIDLLNKYQVSTIIWAASAVSLLAMYKIFNVVKPKYLKNIMFSGEVLPTKAYHYWKKNIPNARYVNLYGPTEITCNCTYYIIDREFERKEQIPIGKPFQNVNVFLLDQEDKLSSEGEICVSGSGVALGYYNNHHETAKRFVQNPINNSFREIIYRTGDLGKYNEFGELVFVGRDDEQIKHMGHRIELAEIEMVVNSLSMINKSCCIYNNNKIVLFYESTENEDDILAETIKKELPNYMRPNRYINLKQVPMNPHGKIDRKILNNFLENGISL